jgi:hypothetical protein
MEPPVHFLPHILELGGLPAWLVGGLAGYLAWPHSVVTLTSGIPLTTYHNQLGASGMTIAAAVAALFVAVIVGAVIGLVLGRILISVGLVKGSEIGIDE